MTFGRMQVAPGMEVVGTAGTPIGHVVETDYERFTVSRSTGDPIAIPYEAIRAMLGNQIVLAVRADALDAQGWTTATTPSSQTAG